MDIACYFINAIGGYYWLLMVINGYWYLFYLWLLMFFNGYSINGYLCLFYCWLLYC